MSTILKALRRLEEERTAKAERALREQVVSASPRGTGNWRRLALGGLGAVAGVALLGFAAHHWLARPATQSAPLAAAPGALSRPAVPPAAPPAAAFAGNPLAAASRPPPQLPPATSPSATPAVTFVPGGETGFQVANQGAARATPAEVRAAAEALTPRPDVAVVQRPVPSQDLVRPTPEASEPARAPEAAPPGTTPPSPRMAPVAAAAEASPPEDAATSSVPIRLHEVDPSLHSPYGIHEDTPSKEPSPHPKAAHPHATPQAGEVVVTRTVWHPSAERRVALVRGAGDSQEREVHEGESVGSLEVLRIEPSDVVFLRDGVEIRQRVGAQP